MRLGPAGAVLSRTWLTADAEAQSSAHLAWLNGRLLAGWRNASGQHVLATVGHVPEAVAVQFQPMEDFVSYPDGSAGWVWAWDEVDRLKVVRIREGS